MIIDLLHKRCLISETRRFSNSNVKEVKVLEIAPSRNWVKLMNMYGNEDFEYNDPICMICGKVCDIVEWIHTGYYYELWCYCKDCKIDTFHEPKEIKN